MLTAPSAVFSKARRRLVGEVRIPSAAAAEATSAKQPAALGDDIDVPFMSCWALPVHTGTCERLSLRDTFNNELRFCIGGCLTQVMAAPGADMLTPQPPSAFGPREDHV